MSACGRRSAALMTTVASIMMAANPSSATIHAPYSLHIEIDAPGHAGRQRHVRRRPAVQADRERRASWSGAAPRRRAHSPASRVCASLAAIGSSAETFAAGT